MVPAKETAEEQLLRMIEGPRAPASPKGPAGRSSVDRVLESFFRGGDFLRRWSRQAQASKGHADVFLWQLQLASRVFWALLGALALALVVYVWVIRPAPPMLPPLPAGSTSSETAPTLAPTAAEQLKQSAEYRSTLAARNPFRLATTRATEGTSAQTVKSKLLDLTSKLSVVGINRGKVPEALIEDTEAKRTYFVKVGDEINGMTVSAIDSSGVKVKYEGEEAVLQ